MANRVVWAGRYAVFDEIASGGMASVYLACRIAPGDTPRVVAIKKLFESFAKQPEFVTMFLDEAHIAARMRHPNIVTTYEFLRIPDSLAIVMEFVLGVSLQDLQRIARERQAIAPLAVTGAILRDALLGLHAAHETTDEAGSPVGLVHRDVSPHNIIVGKEGTAKVIDFGIAKAAGRLQVTEVGVMKGKFAYMAPEQIRAAPVDRRVDIYSAGIVLWEALTGAPLFRGSADAEMFSRRAAGTVTAPIPSSVNGRLPSGLDAVVARALAVDAGERYATALEMADALATVLPMASLRDVAEWVQGLAGSRLREIEAQRNEVETSFATGELADLMPPSTQLHRSSSSDLGAFAPSLPRPSSSEEPLGPTPELDIPELAPRPPPPKPVPKLSPLPSSVVSSQPTSGLDDPFADTQSVDLKLDLGSYPSARTATTSPLSQGTLDARPRATSASEGRSSRAVARRGGWGRGFLVFLVIVGAAGFAAAQLGPPAAKRAVLDAAAKRGLVLTLGSLEARSTGLTLSDVTIALPNVPEVTMTASSIDVDLSLGGDVHKVVIPGYELKVHGTARDLGAHFAAWRAASHVPVAFEAKAGHVLATNLLVDGMQIEGIDVSMVGGARDETSLSLDAPSLSITLPSGMLGPWRARVDTTTEETKLLVSLDRSKPDAPPSLTLTERAALGLVFSAAIPRTKVVRIGVPAEFLHAGSDPELDLSLEAQTMPGGNPLNARITLGLFGILAGATPGGPVAAPVDLLLVGGLSGDPASPLAIDKGTLTLGKVSTHLTGTVSLESDGVRLEMLRAPVRANAVLPPLVFDTRDWTLPPHEVPPKPTPSPPPATSAGRRH